MLIGYKGSSLDSNDTTVKASMAKKMANGNWLNCYWFDPGTDVEPIFEMVISMGGKQPDDIYSVNIFNSIYVFINWS